MYCRLASFCPKLHCCRYVSIAIDHDWGDNGLDDDEDLDAVFSFSLEQVVQSIPLVTRPPEVQLRRDPKSGSAGSRILAAIHPAYSPPVVNVDSLFGHVDGSTKVPEVISLHPYQYDPITPEYSLTPSTSHCAATLTRKGAKESNRFLPVQTHCAAMRSILTMNWCI